MSMSLWNLLPAHFLFFLWSCLWIRWIIMELNPPDVRAVNTAIKIVSFILLPSYGEAPELYASGASSSSFSTT